MNGQPNTKKAFDTIIVNGSDLRKALTPLSQIARNATLPEERVVNFICVGNNLVITTTDSYREGQKIIKANTSSNITFSVNIEKILPALTAVDDVVLEVYEKYLLFKKQLGTLEIPISLNTHRPFKQGESSEEVNLNKFLKQLRSIEKYISVATDDTGVAVMHKGYLYVRSRLFYVITSCELNGFYMFDKGTVKLILSILSSDGEESTKVNLSLTDNGSRIVINSGNSFLKVPKLRTNVVDLSKFNQLQNMQGLVVHRDLLHNALKEIKTISGSNDIDLQVKKAGQESDGRYAELFASPSVVGTLTKFKFVGNCVNCDSRQLEFTYTVNLSTLIELLGGVSNPYVLLSNQSNTMLLMMCDMGDGIVVRYYVSVM